MIELEKISPNNKNLVNNSNNFINEKDFFGKTKMHYAVEDETLSNIQELIELGAEINNQEDMGYTPLYLAVSYNRVDVVNELLHHGANPNIPDLGGNTAVSAAINNNSLLIFEVLVKHKGNIHIKNNDGLSLLHVAARVIAEGIEDWTVIRWLLKYGVSEGESNYTVKNILGERDLSYAIKYDEIVKEIELSGTDSNS